MNSIWWQVAGWTMIHFLWIGSLVFVVTALLRLALFRAAPQLRYAVSLLGLTMLAFSPAIIAWRLASEIEPVVLATEPMPVVAADRYEIPPMDPIAAAEISEPAVIDLKYTPIEAPAMEEPIEAMDAEPVATASPAIAPTPASIEQTFEAAFDPLSLFQTLPSYLPWLWMIGTPATLLLLATGLMGSELLRRRAEPITDPALLETLARLAAGLRLSRRVTIAISDRVLQPVLVGIVRPLILLPSVALTSWSPAEIEMALLHELAHVRRWDNLVNLVQRLVESLLFFHPAVWITSRWVRADREHCCDAVVVAHCGNREAYASLLVSVAKSSVSGRLPSHAMALASHPLARRVRRILQLEDDPMLVSKRTLLSVALMLAALTAGAVWSSTLAEETNSSESEQVSRVVPDPGDEELTVESTDGAGDTEESNPFAEGVGGNDPFSSELGSTDPFAIAEEQSGEVRKTEDAENSHAIDTEFRDTETTKTFIYGVNDPFEKIREVLEKFEQAGHHMHLETHGQQLKVVVTRRNKPPAADSDSTNLPFLSLEDQRIADLAYGMLGVEVVAINAEELAAVKEKGFAGGVKLDEIPGYGGMSSSPAAGAGLVPGDVLVGLHIWPTANLDQLAEVLRRGDLNQFTPLKYFVLRKGISTEHLEGSSPESAARPVEVPSNEWTLHTGRISININEWSDEQQRLKQIELKAEQEAGMTMPLPLPGQPGAVKVGPAEPPAAAAAESELTPPIATTPIAEPADAEPTKPAAPQLLYDGRTFDDWRTEWKTELKTENRTEAIKALRAFGRAGYGKEATEAILEVAEEYPMDTIGHEESPQEALQTAIVSSFVDINDFTGLKNSPVIPSDVTIPIILDWYDPKQENRVQLLSWVLSMSSSKDPDILERVAAMGNDPKMTLHALAHLVRSDPTFERDLTRQLLEKGLASDDPQIVVSSILQLQSKTIQREDGNAYRRFILRTLPANLPPLLFHDDLRVRQYARWALKRANLEQLGNLPELLMDIVEQPGEAVAFGDVPIVEKSSDIKVQKARKLDALRAIAAIGPNAKSISDRLVNLFDGEDADIKVLTEWAISFIYTNSQPQGGPMALVPRELRARIEASMKDQREVKSTIEWNKESVELFPADQGGGRGGFGGDQGGGGMF